MKCCELGNEVSGFFGVSFNRPVRPRAKTIWAYQLNETKIHSETGVSNILAPSESKCLKPRLRRECTLLSAV